jgi:hypothetical protein
MRKAVWFVLAMFALALASGAALAQSPSETVVANIPFAFQVGKIQLPAGEYEIYPAEDSGLSLVVRNMVTGRSIVSSTLARIEWREFEKPELVFDKVDDTCYLAEVHSGAADGFALKTVSEKHSRVTVKSS